MIEDQVEEVDLSLGPEDQVEEVDRPLGSESNPNSKSGTGRGNFKVLTPGGTGVEETTPTYDSHSPTRFSR